MTGDDAAVWRKGLALWIGPAAFGSVLGTLIVDVYAGGDLAADFAQEFNRRFLFVLMEVGLVFTLAGSALLALAFRVVRERLSQGPAYAAVLLIGMAAGGLFLLPMRMPVWGMIYAAATSLAWIGLHRLLFGRKHVKPEG